MEIQSTWDIYGSNKDDPDIYGFLPITYIITHMTVHKYLDHPYWIHKCLNVGRISIFYYIFLCIYFPGIFTELGGLIDINLGVKKKFS